MSPRASIRNAMGEIAKAAVDFILPPVCSACGEDSDGSVLCNACTSLIQPVEKNFCQLCGQPLSRSRRSYICSQCVRKPLALERVRAWALFTYPLDTLVYELKYRRRKGLAGYFARHLTVLLQSDPFLRTAHLIVPVPLNPLKSWWRGYNQSALIADRLSQSTGIPSCEILRRSKYTRTQTRLSAERRRKNVEGAFRLDKKFAPDSITGKKIILVDDVITSGATLDAAAEVLLDSGADAVYGLTIGGAWIAR
jgi:ComF family protein